MVSGSQDCTIKMWRIGRSLVEEGEGSGQERKTKKLKVKYTQLAHDKVSVYNMQHIVTVKKFH